MAMHELERINAEKQYRQLLEARENETPGRFADTKPVRGKGTRAKGKVGK